VKKFNSFILPELSVAKKKKMLQQALIVLEAQKSMMHGGKSILNYTLQRKKQHIGQTHYPKGDRIDYVSGAQYFYHCHRENIDTLEHGHFHSFMRYKAIPKRIKPTQLADWDKNIDSPMAHIAAIGMNQFGQPIRLFTVNRWVSFETWYDAEHVDYFLKKFTLRIEEDPYWESLDRWVAGMHALFAPQISWLHLERDKRIAERKKKYPKVNPYEDERIEELSEISIDLAQQVNWIAS